MNRRRGFILTVMMLVGVLGLGGCFELELVNVAGTWSGSISWTSGPATGFTSPITLTLDQQEKETEITGQIGLMGPGSKPFSIPITEGTAGGDQFTISASGEMDVATPHASVQIDLSGERSGDSLSGTGTQEIDGVPNTFDWSATLQPSAE